MAEKFFAGLAFGVLGGGMHTVFFGMKKIHWRIVGMTQRMIADYRVTPARFDLMRVLHAYGDWVPQSTLRWLLGVAAPTVSRMLKALETHGHITRQRSPRDARCLDVRLTGLGSQTTRMCLFEIVGMRDDERVPALGVLGIVPRPSKLADEVYRDIDNGKTAVDLLTKLLANMRKAFEDTAPYPHPWRHPDSLRPLAYTTLVNGRLSYGDDALQLV